MPPAAVWLVAAALETARIATGWTVIDEFAARFVYFYTGYLFAPRIFALAALVQARPALAGLGLAGWCLLEGFAVFGGYSELPLVSLALGLVGASAVVSVSALFAKVRLFDPLRFCGRNSIVIYLSFFLPMASTRTALLGSGLIGDVGVVSLIVTIAGVLGALALWWATRGTRLDFLWVRPARFRLAPPRPALQPAE